MSNLKSIRFKMIYVPIMLLLILGALMVGITDYIMAGFSFENFKKADFWINIITTNVGSISMIISLLLIKIDRFKEQNEEYLHYQDAIVVFRRDDYVAPLMQKFYFDDNLKTKIVYYKESINKEFSKIKPTEEDLKIYYDGTDEEKQNNKYCVKMEYYDKILSTEYINRVVPKLDIDYPKIDDDVLFTGNIKSKGSTDYITKHKAKKVILDYLPSFLFAFSFTVLSASIVPDFKQVTLAIVVKTIAKIFTLVSQVYFVLVYSDKYNKEVTLHDIIFRHKKILEYKIWVSNQIKNINKEV